MSHSGTVASHDRRSLGRCAAQKSKRNCSKTPQFADKAVWHGNCYTMPQVKISHQYCGAQNKGRRENSRLPNIPGTIRFQPVRRTDAALDRPSNDEPQQQEETVPCLKD